MSDQVEEPERQLEKADHEKTLAAERVSTVVRVFVIVFTAIIFALLPKDQVNKPLAYSIIVFTWIYSWYFYFAEPYKKYPVLTTAWFSYSTDAFFITIWLFATGGFYSPYYIIYLGSIMAVAFRFTPRVTLLTSFIYSACYLGLILIQGQLPGHETETVFRIGFIFILGYMGDRFSRETLEQTRQKLRLRQLTEKNRLGEEKLRFLNANLEERIRERTAKLEESMERFRNVFETIPQIAWTASPDGKPLYFNSRFFEFTGADEKNIYSSGRWLQYVHPDDLEYTERHWNNAVRLKQPYYVEYRWRRGDGQYRWMLGRALPVKNKEGEITLWVGTCTDIHDQKLASEALESRVTQRTNELSKANFELARSNNELEQFAYVASHDLQEPLRMISSYTQLMQSRYRHKLDGEALEFMNFILDGAKQMSSLIHDLLNYSRIGRIEDAFSEVSVSEVIERAMRGFEGLIHDTGAKISIGEMPVVFAIPTQVYQVFQNLIGNALKFRKPGVPPEITVSAKKEGDEFWQFSVSDNGIGIDKAYWDRFFVLFQRLHNRDKYDGTGIGLAICKKIIERNGGRIWLESATGKGTTFFFTLKAAGKNPNQ